MPLRAKILVLEEQDSLHDALERMVRVLRQEMPIDREDPVLLRIETRSARIDLFDLLLRSGSPEKFYWSDRNATFEWMGLGTAIKLEANEFDSFALMGRMQQVFEAIGSDVQFFGGARFNAIGKPNDALWRQFATWCFVLPTLEVKISDDVACISLNLLNRNSAEVEKAIALLRELLERKNLSVEAPPPPRIKSESRSMNLLEWSKKVASSAELLSNGDLNKIVLANAHDFWLEEDVDPVWLLMKLNQKSPLTYRFLMQLSHHQAFVGASPEQLYARNGQRIESEAQAGTRPRGRDLAEDTALADELLASPKEFIEHDVVVQDIEKELGLLCRDSGWIDQRRIIKLSHVQHLRSRFGGILNDGIIDAQIIQALHPTPAVCGWPKETAHARIAEFENFDRGYYCGPVGMVGKNKTELAVALRSALVSDRHVRVFAGAGLVEGSVATSEWNEIDSKMRLYYDILRK